MLLKLNDIVALRGATLRGLVKGVLLCVYNIVVVYCLGIWIVVAVVCLVAISRA